jgi:hypothetical protein
LRLATIGLFVFSLAACETAGSTSRVGPVAPAPGSPASATPPAASCPVAITLTITGAGLRRQVIVSAENRDTGVQELVVPDRCPSGPIDFSGLPAGYDYYGTCAMGACPGERAATRLGLGLGESRELARTTLDLGDATCNEPVPAGEYRLSASVPGVEPACVGSVVLVVGTPDTNPTRPTPKPDPTPDSAGIDFQACTADSDCIVHCPRAQGCCGSPCGCQTAVNKAHTVAFDAHYARTCQKAPDCPAMGCAYEPHYSARCVNNRCRSSAGL